MTTQIINFADYKAFKVKPVHSLAEVDAYEREKLAIKARITEHMALYGVLKQIAREENP